jgi:hypothetical protein
LESVASAESVAPPQQSKIDYMLEYPPLLPRTLERGDALYIAGSFADDTRAILHAETYIAERRYRQMLMAAQAHKLAFMKARRRYERALNDADWLLHFATDQSGPKSNPDWDAPAGLSSERRPGETYVARRITCRGPKPCGTPESAQVAPVTG